MTTTMNFCRKRLSLVVPVTNDGTTAEHSDGCTGCTNRAAVVLFTLGLAGFRQLYPLQQVL